MFLGIFQFFLYFCNAHDYRHGNLNSYWHYEENLYLNSFDMYYGYRVTQMFFELFGMNLYYLMVLDANNNNAFQCIEQQFRKGMRGGKGGVSLWA